MPKVATKLFREPGEAKTAISELKAAGFKASEIRLITSAKRAKELDADVKPVTDAGELTDLGIPEETVDYYQYAISSGGIVISVHAEEDRVARAQELLRTLPICSCDDSMYSTSPGFNAASRMSATNPIDAPMSGDFRRY